MGRDVGGRQPNASIDERRAQTQRQSNGDVRVRGNGRYMRDYNDRGRDFSFDCTYSSRNNWRTRHLQLVRRRLGRWRISSN